MARKCLFIWCRIRSKQRINSTLKRTWFECAASQIIGNDSHDNVINELQLWTSKISSKETLYKMRQINNNSQNNCTSLNNKSVVSYRKDKNKKLKEGQIRSQNTLHIIAYAKFLDACCIIMKERGMTSCFVKDIVF